MCQPANASVPASQLPSAAPCLALGGLAESLIFASHLFFCLPSVCGRQNPLFIRFKTLVETSAASKGAWSFPGSPVIWFSDYLPSRCQQLFQLCPTTAVFTLGLTFPDRTFTVWHGTGTWGHLGCAHFFLPTHRVVQGRCGCRRDVVFRPQPALNSRWHTMGWPLCPCLTVTPTCF